MFLLRGAEAPGKIGRKLFEPVVNRATPGGGTFRGAVAPIGILGITDELFEPVVSLAIPGGGLLRGAVAIFYNSLRKKVKNSNP